MFNTVLTNIIHSSAGFLNTTVFYSTHRDQLCAFIWSKLIAQHLHPELHHISKGKYKIIQINRRGVKNATSVMAGSGMTTWTNNSEGQDSADVKPDFPCSYHHHITGQKIGCDQSSSLVENVIWVLFSVNLW